MPTRHAISHDPVDRLTLQDERLVEALLKGLPLHRAAKEAQMCYKTSLTRVKEPHIQEAVASRRTQLRHQYRLSRERCVEGILDAIQQAKLLSDPATQINGWREIARMLGHYEPEKKVIELSDQREEALKQLETLAVDELLELAGDNVIDGQFKLIERS